MDTRTGEETSSRKLGFVAMPELSEIAAKDPQFKPVEISQEESEATSARRDD